MKIRKRYLVMGGIALFLVLFAGIGFIVANGPCGDPGWRPHSGFHGKGFHPGFRGKYFSNHAMDRLDGIASHLNLNEEQERKFQEIKGQIRTDFESFREERERLFSDLRNEIGGENPDMARITETVKTGLAKMPLRVGNAMDLFVEFYDSLDRDQKTLIINGIREKMERHGNP